MAVPSARLQSNLWDRPHQQQQASTSEEDSGRDLVEVGTGLVEKGLPMAPAMAVGFQMHLVGKRPSRGRPTGWKSVAETEVLLQE